MKGRYPQVCNNAIWSLGEMTLRIGEDMTPYGEMILPLLISMNSQARVSPGIKDNSTIAICRFCLVCPQVVVFAQQYFPSLCMNVAKLRDTEEKEQAAKGLCVVIHRVPAVLNEHFPNFVAMVASWWARRRGLRRRNTISNMEVGQMMLSVLNEFKRSKGAEWESFYNQQVDIRFRQILRNNFNFEWSVCSTGCSTNTSRFVRINLVNHHTLVLVDHFHASHPIRREGRSHRHIFVILLHIDHALRRRRHHHLRVPSTTLSTVSPATLLLVQNHTIHFPYRHRLELFAFILLITSQRLTHVRKGQRLCRVLPYSHCNSRWLNIQVHLGIGHRARVFE